MFGEKHDEVHNARSNAGRHSPSKPSCVGKELHSKLPRIFGCVPRRLIDREDESNRGRIQCVLTAHSTTLALHSNWFGGGRKMKAAWIALVVASLLVGCAKGFYPVSTDGWVKSLKA